MKERLHRAGWLFMVILFVATSIGIGVYAFWQNTHPSPAQQTTNQNNCQFQQVSAPTLTAPEVYKPAGAATQLQITDLQVGSGQAVQSGDCVTTKYYGTLASDGTVFDEDFTNPTALQFSLGQGQVIPGWDEGLIGMKVGGLRRLVIPPSLAYGSQAQGKIPANSTLVFVVKLISVK